MRFVCLGYADEKKWEAMSEREREALIEECLAYDEKLTRDGHWTGHGEALQTVRAARTLRRKEGKTIVSDGPFVETKEQLGGFGLLEARDMNHAVELMSKHPGVRLGPFEIRPVDEKMTEHCRETNGAPDPAAPGTKFICLAYGNENNWNALSESEQEAVVKECFAYGDVLKRYGAWAGGEALQGGATAKTLRTQGGMVVATDGPYAETKEQLGGYAAFKFADMQQAIEAWSQHPCLRIGDSLELRPVDEEFTARVAARLEHAQAK